MSNNQVSFFSIPISWPVTLGGELQAAHGVSLRQYEFNCADQIAIAKTIPVVSGNPYVVTVSNIKGKKNNGIPVECKYMGWHVIGQFHRHPNNKGIWLYTDYSNRGYIATEEWNKFVSHFGIKIGELHKPVPVFMDLYQDKKIVIRLQPNFISPRPSPLVPA